MMRFGATYFDGKTSRAYPVTVIFDGSALTMDDESGLAITAPVWNCSIDPRLGRMKRSIRLPNGGLLQTGDETAVAHLEKSMGVNRSWNTVHFLESHWKAVVGCLFCLVFALFAIVYYAIPQVSKKAAAQIPPQITADTSSKTLALLDRQFLKPSTLSPERTEEITAIFHRVVGVIDPQYADTYVLEFRSGNTIGANAFALPSGIVIITDELVKLSENPDELAAIFAHEVAHVKRRHAIRHILQSTGIFFLISLLTGDITSAANFAAVLPALLIESGYSREFETEADHDAGQLLLSYGKGTAPFRNILQKIDASHPESMKLGVFSSHPETVRRIEELKQMEGAR